MCMVSTPKPPRVDPAPEVPEVEPPPPPPPPQPPQIPQSAKAPDTSAMTARDNEIAARKRAATRNGTVATSPLGLLGTANTAQKSLLGQ